MSKNERLSGERLYGKTAYAIAIACAIAALIVPVFVLMFPKSNMLDPVSSFSKLLSEATPAEIWAESRYGSFLGAHAYFTSPQSLDAWAMLVINVGCLGGFFGLVPSVIVKLRSRSYLDAALCGALACLIFLSAAGVF